MNYFKLTKIRSKHDNLRTDVVIGSANSDPEVGQSFVLFSEALDPEIASLGGLRSITTSTVQQVEEIEDGFIFTTLNSTYKLERIHEQAGATESNNEPH